jgi:hypothetical protein
MESNNEWFNAIRQQNDEREANEIAEDQKIFDGFGAIEQNAKQQSILRDRQRAIAGAAMMQSAFKNGGMSDRSLSAAFSEAFGQPIYGGQIVDLGEGQGRGFVLYGAAKDANGNQSIGPVAMMNGAQMLKVLQSAKLGDRTADLQKEIYNDLSSRFTPEQIGSMGVQNPSAPISKGSTTISGSAMRALRGQPRQRSTISVFSNVGGDGRVGSGSHSAIIRPDGTREEYVTGTRDPNYQGRWKVRVSDADGKLYENDKTGEEIRVPNGTNLGDVLAARTRKPSNGLTFEERLALQRAADNAKTERQTSQNQNRLAIAQLNAEQRQKAAEAARVLKELGYAIDIDLAEAKAADASARSMANAKTGITNEAKYTPEQIEAEKKRAEEARKRARGKVGSRQANPSSGDNRTMPTVAKDTNSITMPDGKVVKKNETYTDSRGRTMRWVGPGPKDWKIVK